MPIIIIIIRLSVLHKDVEVFFEERRRVSVQLLSSKTVPSNQVLICYNNN